MFQGKTNCAGARLSRIILMPGITAKRRATSGATWERLRTPTRACARFCLTFKPCPELNAAYKPINAEKKLSKRPRDLSGLATLSFARPKKPYSMPGVFSLPTGARKKVIIELDRKILSDLAANHPEIFKQIIETARQ